MDRLDFIRREIVMAGRLVLGMKGTAKKRNKDPHDYVTDADIASETYLVKRIKSSFPNDSIYSEEAGKAIEINNSEGLWILDPIDGTNNFAFGLPLYGISVAYAQKGIVTHGGIYLPELGRLYLAEKGKGATLNGKKIRVSGRSELKNSLVLFESRLAKTIISKKSNAIFNVAKKCFGIRLLGVAVFNLGYIASGEADASVMTDLKVVDFAAGALIVDEAGGKVTDTSGKKWNLETKSFAVTNGKIHKELLSLLK